MLIRLARPHKGSLAGRRCIRTQLSSVGPPDSVQADLEAVENPFPAFPAGRLSPMGEALEATASRLACRQGLEPLVRHLSVRRVGYTHHGIALGDGTVVHFTGEPLHKTDARVQRTSLEAFLRGGLEREKCVPRQLMLHRSLTGLLALLHIGLSNYHLRDRNCEHFALYCQSGSWHSHQIHDIQTSEPGIGAIFKVLEAAVDATLGRAAAYAERLAAPDAQPEVDARQANERSVFFYGDLWQDDDSQVWVHTPVRQGGGGRENAAGFWGFGVPWGPLVSWGRTPPTPDRAFAVGEIFVDDQLAVYLFHEQAGWLRANARFTADALPPLPEPHPALVERKYPMDWFE